MATQCRSWLGICVVLSVIISGCAPAPLNYPRTASYAIAAPEWTPLGHAYAPLLSQHAGESGFFLLAKGPDAMIARLALIGSAASSIDAQYYEFNNDFAGDLFVSRLFAAAARGVHVRLLVDDWSQAGEDARLAGISAYPNIEVRIFNPVGSPRWSHWTRRVEHVFGPARIQKRMHNKALIIDSTAAIVGGRNIGDAYYEVPGEFDFGDLDLLALGPILPEISACFDQYWNDPLAIPAEAFVQGQDTSRFLKEVQQALAARMPSKEYVQYTRAERESSLAPEIPSAKLPLLWATGGLLYDKPVKAVASIKEAPEAYMVQQLRVMVDAARTEALIITPYLVPGPQGMVWFRGLRERGVAIRVLTNSLASTDEIAAYGAYERYRGDMLRCGIELYELRAMPGISGAGPLKSGSGGSGSRSSLHAKCIVIDRQVVFVGSFNIDRRSPRLNTEEGIVVHSHELAEQLVTIFGREISPKYAYRLVQRGTLKGTDDRHLSWIGERNGLPFLYDDDPGTSVSRRIKAWILSWLVPESWL